MLSGNTGFRDVRLVWWVPAGLLSAATRQAVAIASLIVFCAGLLAWRAGGLHDSSNIPAPTEQRISSPTLEALAAVRATPVIPDVAEALQGASQSEHEEPAAPGSFTGRVLRPDGAAAPGVKARLELITWRPEESAPPATFRRDTVADEEGRVFFEGLVPNEGPGKEYCVLAWNESAVAATRFYLPAHAPSAQADLLLQPAVPLGGQVVDASGTPVPGLTLYPHECSMLRGSPPAAVMLAALRVETDQDGRFQFPALWPGAWRLFTQGPDQPSILSQPINTGTLDACITLPTPGDVVFRVVRADTHEPVAGVVVKLQQQALPRDTRRVVSDASGACTLSGLAPGSYQVLPADAVLVPAQEDMTLAVASGVGQDIEIPVRPGAIVHGRVYDSKSGEGIVGVKLELGRHHIETDALGEYAFQGLPAETFRIYLHPGANSPYRINTENAVQQVHLQAGGEKRLDFVLTRGIQLAGKVTLPDGTPVARAKVDVHSKGSFGFRGNLAWTEEDGSFVLEGMQPTNELVLWASKEDRFSRKRSDLTLGPEGRSDATLVLDLKADAELHGRITDATPGEYLHLYLVPQDDSLSMPEVVQPNPLGEFSVLKMLPGAFEMFILHRRGGQRGECSVGLFVVAQGERRNDIEVACPAPGGATLRGRVATAANAPITGATIRPLEGGAFSATSDATGGFLLEGIPEIPGTLVVQHPEYATVRLNDVVPGGETLTISLPSRATLTGQVTDAVRHAPVPAYTIELREHIRDWNSSLSTSRKVPVADPAGQYTLEAVDPGMVSIGVSAEGFVDAEEILRVEPGAPSIPLEFVLTPAVKVDGYVVDGQGLPLPGAHIYVAGAPREPQYNTGDAVTDSEGYFVLRECDAASVPLFAWAEGYAITPAQTPAGGGTVRIQMQPPAILDVDVTACGQPVELGTLTLRNEAGYFISNEINSTGPKLENLPLGTFDAHITLQDCDGHHREAKLQIVLEAGLVTTLALDFPQRDASVLLRVLQDGAPVQSGRVRLVLQANHGETEDINRSLSTATQDALSLDDVLPGAATLEVTVGDQTQLQSFTLEPGEVREITLQFPPLN